MNLQYDNARLSLKVLISFFLIFVGLSYCLALVNIQNNMGLSYTGVVVHYRGDVKEATDSPDLAFSKLIQEHHVHLFSLSILFLIIGLLFTFTNLPEFWKALFVGAPFVGMAMDFGGIWLTVFSSPVFGWLTVIFGAFMAFSFFMLIGRPLYEMWILPIWEKKFNGKVPWYLR